MRHLRKRLMTMLRSVTNKPRIVNMTEQGIYEMDVSQ